MASWVWALLPVVTVGWVTAPCMIYAAVHKRNSLHGVLAALYAASLVVLAITVSIPDDSTLDYVFGAVMFLSWSVGGAHALGIRRWVFDLPRPNNGTPGLADKQQAALAAVEEEAEARREALRIVESDPSLAVTLKIGRIDMPGRAFPDGGLIDVNNVPATALKQATGLPDLICRRITETRPKVGGYESVTEMSVTLDLPPHLLDTIADRLVFLPIGQRTA